MWPGLLFLAGLSAGVVAGWLLRGRLAAEALRTALSEARTDALTGLPNRRAWEERLAAQHAQAVRYGTPCSVVMFDLNRFKQVNDRRGHSAGDEVLKEIAQRLQAAVREADLPARFGGDEFAVLCPETGLAGASILAGRLQRVLFADSEELQGVTAGFGVAEWHPEDTPASLMERADAALRAAKSRPRAP